MAKVKEYHTDRVTYNMSSNLSDSVRIECWVVLHVARVRSHYIKYNGIVTSACMQMGFVTITDLE